MYTPGLVIPKRRFLPLLLAAAPIMLAWAAPTVDQVKVDRVLVLKKEHKLLLLSGTRVVRSYRVALGRGGIAPKRQRGDGRTPEGLYTIDWRNPASKYHRALHISYPQRWDAERAQRLGVNPGGDIEIHGLGDEYDWIGADHRRTDWTEGCIAVTNSEIDEIWKLVPDGTPVEVRRSSGHAATLQRVARH